MTEAVVRRTLVAVLEDLVGFVDLLEAMVRVAVARIAIRVEFHGELAVGGLQIAVVSAALNAKDLVIVALGHTASPRHDTYRPPPPYPSPLAGEGGVGAAQRQRAVAELGR